MTRLSESGMPIEAVYGLESIKDFDAERDLAAPAEFPFTRGVHPTMYVARPWTMRQDAGFSTAADSNQRYHQLIKVPRRGRGDEADR